MRQSKVFNVQSLTNHDENKNIQTFLSYNIRAEKTFFFIKTQTKTLLWNFITWNYYD